MSLARDAQAFARLARARLRERRLAPHVRRRTAERGIAEPGRFEVLVHFADPAVNLYQLRQWYEPLRLLAEQHPVAIAVRSADVAMRVLDESPLPVVWTPTVTHAEQLLAQQGTLAVLYVNQNSRNFTVLRFGEPAHVFCNHGESDKAYMVSNQVKAYDLVLVAGPAAVRRLEGGVYDLERARLAVVGRPQIDVEHEGPRLPHDARTVVLYAPTWEGDRPSNSSSSVASHGEAVVAALLATGRHRVIYRPHPRTGVEDREVARANARIVRLVRAANREDPAAGHVADLASPFGWQLAAAGVCLTDISAAAYDWAATGKPLLLTEPVASEAWVDREGIAGTVPLVRASDAADVVAQIDALVADGAGERYAALVRDHFGDTTPGESMARFLETIHGVVEERRAARAARAAQAARLAGTVGGAGTVGPAGPAGAAGAAGPAGAAGATGSAPTA